MLPGSTQQRSREIAKQPEGRAGDPASSAGARSVMDMKNLGENTLWADCDVLEADGGTRTAP